MGLSVLDQSPFIVPEGGSQSDGGLSSPIPAVGAGVAPQGSVGVFVICAETESEAQRLAASRDLMRLRRYRGILGPVPPPEEALAYPYSLAELRRIAHYRRHA